VEPLLNGNAQSQTAAKIHAIGGGALKRHQKQNRKKLPKSTRNSPQKVTQNGMALSSVQVLQQANYTINVTLIKKFT